MESLAVDAIELQENPLRELMLDSVQEKPLSLAELIKRYQEIEEALIESGGLAVFGDQLAEVEGKIEQKLDACKGLIDYWKGQVAYLEEKEKCYKSRKSGIKGGIEWLRGSMKSSMLLTGKEKIKTPEGSYYFTKPRTPVKVLPELVTEKYAHAMQVTGMSRYKVTITFDDDGVGTWIKYARELQTATGCEVQVSEPEYDLTALAARYQGTNRLWPPYLIPAEKTFTMR